jgi:hypothetical protein
MHVRTKIEAGMKFGHHYSIRKKLSSEEFIRGMWGPTALDWRDVVEDYLYISKKRTKSKFSIFKLQVQVAYEIMTNINSIDKYKKLQATLHEDEKAGRITTEEYNDQLRHFKSEVFILQLVNKVLREIIDGIVWRYLNFNRAILYTLADKEPIEVIRADKGTLANLLQFSEIFLDHDSVAIYNDISNFLRIGDITQITKDGNIQIIEVKAGKGHHGKRIIRQKEKMEEVVEFFNTGNTTYNGKKLKIIDSDIKQVTYLPQLVDAIKRAKAKGYESLLIGDYMILELVYFDKLNGSDDVSDYFKIKHKSVKDKWKKNGDYVHGAYWIDKMNYSISCAPFSIYPFDIETCADIMMGKISIHVFFNFSEILRILEKAGWSIADALIFKSQTVLESLYGKDMKDVSFLKLRKGQKTMDIPPSIIARMNYELLTPKSVLNVLEELYDRGSRNEFELVLVNYSSDRKYWA